MNEGKGKRIVVVFGGRSGEHEVSLMSAASILKAIDRERYEVVPVGITREGDWIQLSDDSRLPGRLTAAAQAEGTGAGAAEAEGTGAADAEGTGSLFSSGRLIHSNAEGRPAERSRLLAAVDCVFPVLHGPYGEDGTIQGLLELAGVPYVGSGVLGSAVGMDKGIMKDLFRANEIPTVDSLVFGRRRWEGDPDSVRAEIEAAIGYPCFVKPVNLGSSVGIHKAGDRDALLDGIGDACRYDRRVIVEKAVPDAREIECSVLGNDAPKASVPGEVIPCNEFYDYRAKYVDGDSDLIIPADLPAETATEIRALAVKAFRCLDLAGMARVDFFLEKESGRIWLNEVNTIPGFTQISMYPKLWEASGIGYRELITRLIDLAVDRYEEKRRSTTDYPA